MSLAEPRWRRFSPEGPLVRPRGAPYLPSSSRRTQLRPQVLQSHQVGAGAGEGEHRAHLLLSSMPELAQTPGHLHPAEGFFHDLAPTLTHGVSLPAGGPLVDGRCTSSSRPQGGVIPRPRVYFLNMSKKFIGGTVYDSVAKEVVIVGTEKEANLGDIPLTRLG
jgi:hypothetical protein